MEVGRSKIGGEETQGFSVSQEYREGEGSEAQIDDRKARPYSQDQVEEFVASLEEPIIGGQPFCSSEEEVHYAVYADLKPPGDCLDPKKYEQLRNEVNRACKRPIGCQKADSDEVIMEKIGKIAECISARGVMNTTCFRGGNSKHRKAVAGAVNAEMFCWDVISKRQEHRAHSSKDMPQALSRELWENAARLTGLSGAALLGYLILSEGSRLFPPRNLVPVP